MSVTVVGGDNLGGIARNLYALGVTELVHISGRKPAARKAGFSRGTAFVVVLCDYINHNTVQRIKALAKAQMIPVIYARRSWRSVEEKLLASPLLFCSV